MIWRGKCLLLWLVLECKSWPTTKLAAQFPKTNKLTFILSIKQTKHVWETDTNSRLFLGMWQPVNPVNQMLRVRRTAIILQGAVSVARCFQTCCLPLALVLALQLPAGLSSVFSWYGCHLGTPRTEARRRGGVTQVPSQLLQDRKRLLG